MRMEALNDPSSDRYLKLTIFIISKKKKNTLKIKAYSIAFNLLNRRSSNLIIKSLFMIQDSVSKAISFHSMNGKYLRLFSNLNSLLFDIFPRALFYLLF